jgi:hypothetical protein
LHEVDGKQSVYVERGAEVVQRALKKAGCA